MDLLWPDSGPEEAAPRLHKAAHYARRTLDDPDSLVLAGEFVALFPGRDVQVDAVEFETRGRCGIGRRRPRAPLVGRPHGTPASLLPDDPYAAWAEEARDRLRLSTSTCSAWPAGGTSFSPSTPADEEAHLALITGWPEPRRPAGGAPPVRAAGTGSAPRAGCPPEPGGRRAAGSAARHPPEHRAGPTRSVGPVAGRSRIGPAHLERLPRHAVTGGADGRLFVSGPPAWARRPSWPGSSIEAAAPGDAGRQRRRRQVEGAWPYAPVLEALADLSRRHPALLDGLDDVLRKEIESGLSGPDRRVDQPGRASTAVRRGGRTAPARRRRGGSRSGRRRRRPGRRGEPAAAALPGPQHRPGAGAAGARPPSTAEPGAGPGPAEPARPRHRRHLGPAAAALSTTSSDLVRHLEPAADERPSTRLRRVGRTAAVRRRTRPVSRGRSATWSPSRWCRPSGPRRPDRWPRRRSSAPPSTPTSSSRSPGCREADGIAALERALGADACCVRTDAGWEFRHASVRDALLARVPAVPAATPAPAGGAGAEALDRPAARIGYHLLQAGDRAGAVPWMIEAARSSATLGRLPRSPGQPRQRSAGRHGRGTGRPAVACGPTC